jgi:hypothetical protein
MLSDLRSAQLADDLGFHTFNVFVPMQAKMNHITRLKETRMDNASSADLCHLDAEPSQDFLRTKPEPRKATRNLQTDGQVDS